MPESEPQSTIVMSHIADMKAQLAANTEKTSNVEKTTEEIKATLNKIRDDVIGRREFTDTVKGIRDTLEIHSREIESLIGTRNKTIGALIALQIVWGLVVFLVNKFL